MIKLKANNKRTIGKLVLVTIIGVTESLLTKAITIDQAASAIFSSFTIVVLRKQRINKQIVELVGEGCLLENFESLLPHLLEDQILTIKKSALELLRSLEEDKLMDMWIES
jgi:hypothetical protein